MAHNGIILNETKQDNVFDACLGARLVPEGNRQFLLVHTIDVDSGWDTLRGRRTRELGELDSQGDTKKHQNISRQSCKSLTTHYKENSESGKLF